MALEDRVAAYIGANNLPGNTDLDEFLKNGTAKHLRYLSPAQQRQYATEVTVSDSTGYDLSNNILVDVDKGGYPSVEVPSNWSARITDSDSLFEATDESPAHYVSEGTLHVEPGGGTARILTLPDVDADTDTEIAVLPPDLETATVIYGAIQVLNSNLADAVADVVDTLTLPTAPTLTSYPSQPSPTLSAAPTVSATSVGTLPTPPSYSAPSKPTDLSTDYDAFDTREDDDDVEVAQTILGKIQSELEEYGLDVKNSVTGFQADLEDFNREVDRLIQQAQITLQEAIKDADLSLQQDIEEYRLTLQEYQAEVQAVTAENQNLLAEFNTETQAEINRYSAELQGALGLVDAELKQISQLLTEYQSIMQPYFAEESSELQLQGQRS